MPNVVDRLGGASSSLAFKAPCRLATTANLSSLSGFVTIDGVLPTSTEHVDLRRILVKNQTDASANGVYTMDTGDWVRTKDFDGANDFRRGTRVFVWGGSSQSGGYVVTSDMDPSTFDFDTDDIDFTAQASVDITNFQFADNTGLYDDNGDEQLILQKASTTTAAANYLEITNSTAGAAPQISANGSDSSVNLKLTAKSTTGKVTSTSLVQLDAALASSAITASGLVTISSSLAVSGGASFSSGLAVTGTLAASSAITASGTVTASSDLSVAGVASLLGGIKELVNILTTSTTSVSNVGTEFISSAAGTWTLAAPAAGAVKRFFATSTSSALRKVTLASGNIEAGQSVPSNITAGSSYTTLVFVGQGQCFTLVGKSTSIFALFSAAGFSTGSVPLSTA